MLSSPVTLKMKVKITLIKNKKSLNQSRKKKKIKARNSKIQKTLIRIPFKMMRKILSMKLTTIKKSKKEKLLCYLNKDSMTRRILNTIFAGSFQDITGSSRTKETVRTILSDCSLFLCAFFMC